MQNQHISNTIYASIDLTFTEVTFLTFIFVISMQNKIYFSVKIKQKYMHILAIVLITGKQKL